MDREFRAMWIIGRESSRYMAQSTSSLSLGSSHNDSSDIDGQDGPSKSTPVFLESTFARGFLGPRNQLQSGSST